MATPSEIARFMTQVVTVRPFAAESADGSRTYGASFPLQARVRRSKEELRRPDGQVAVVRLRALARVTDTPTPVTIRDRIVDADGVEYDVLGAEVVRSPRGSPHYQEVLCG